MIDSLLRKTPSFWGKQRLARFLLRNEIENRTDIIVDGQYGCIYKIPNAKENIGFEIFINGIYEEETIEFIVGHLKPNSVLIDLGANIGAICIPVCKRRKDIKALCIEAAPWIFEYLVLNLDKNEISGVKCFNKAISHEGNKRVLFYGPHIKFGKGSLSPVFTSEGVEVETITIDNLVESCNGEEIGMIKIDVEGFELQAFAGGVGLLKSDSAPDILFEFVDWAENQTPGGKAGRAQVLLIEYGYTIYHVNKNRIGEKLTAPITVGSHMFLASKDPKWDTFHLG